MIFDTIKGMYYRLKVRLNWRVMFYICLVFSVILIGIFFYTEIIYLQEMIDVLEKTHEVHMKVIQNQAGVIESQRKTINKIAGHLQEINAELMVKDQRVSLTMKIRVVSAAFGILTFIFGSRS